MNIGILSQDKDIHHEIVKIISQYDSHIKIISFYNLDEWNQSEECLDFMLFDNLLRGSKDIKMNHETKIVYVINHADELNCFFESNMLGFILKSNMRVMLLMVLECFKQKMSFHIHLPLKLRDADVDEKEILYFYVQDTMFYAVLKNEVVELKIRKFQDLDVSQKHFVFINRKYLVNLFHVKSVNKINRNITMTNGKTMIVSRRKMNEFMNQYLHVCSDKILVKI